MWNSTWQGALAMVCICTMCALLTNADEALHAAARSIGVNPQELLRASRMTRRTPSSLANILKADKSASITAAGAVQFGCHLHDHPVDTTGVLGINPQVSLKKALQAGGTQSDSISFRDAFWLHSRANSTLKIYLEFQGCMTKGTDGWNKHLRLETIETPAYDSDGKPGFSTEELVEIITIWKGVSEHFALWDVDVTTEDPGPEGLERSNDPTDVQYGIRVCVGGNGDWTGAVIGGIALMNSFGYVTTPGGEVYRDCFVFSSNLINREDGKVNIGYVWKSISHEVGHTVGLAHKGMRLPNTGKVEEYYSYPAQVECPSNTDDDLVIISAALPLLGDELGTSAPDARVLCSDTQCAASPLNPNLTTTAVTARISSATDRDFYKMAVSDASEPVKITLEYEPNWSTKSVDSSTGKRFLQVWRVSNLRLQLQFLQQDVVVNGQEESEWSTQQDFVVKLPKPGTYTFWVQPTEVLCSSSINNSSSSNSSSLLSLPTNYGNVGQYSLTATFITNAAQQQYNPNAAPIAAPDAFSTKVNTTLDHLDLLANDSDPENDRLSVISVTAPQHGHLNRVGDGVYSYTPFETTGNTTDAFLYTASDGRGGSATGLVTINID